MSLVSQQPAHCQRPRSHTSVPFGSELVAGASPFLGGALTVHRRRRLCCQQACPRTHPGAQSPSGVFRATSQRSHPARVPPSLDRRTVLARESQLYCFPVVAVTHYPHLVADDSLFSHSSEGPKGKVSVTGPKSSRQGCVPCRVKGRICSSLPSAPGGCPHCWAPGRVTPALASVVTGRPPGLGAEPPWASLIPTFGVTRQAHPHLPE